MSTLFESYPTTVVSDTRAGHFSRGNEGMNIDNEMEKRIEKILKSPVPVRPRVAGHLVFDESPYEISMKEASLEIMSILNETSSDSSSESNVPTSSSSEDLQDGLFFEGIDINESLTNDEEDDFTQMKNLSTSGLRFTFRNHSPPSSKSDSSYLLTTIRPPTRSDNPLPYNESFYSSSTTDKEGAEIGLFSFI